MKIYVVFREENGVDKYVRVFTNEKKAAAYVEWRNSDRDEHGVPKEFHWYCPDLTSNIDFTSL